MIALWACAVWLYMLKEDGYSCVGISVISLQPLLKRSCSFGPHMGACRCPADIVHMLCPTKWVMLNLLNLSFFSGQNDCCIAGSEVWLRRKHSQCV